MRKLIALAVLAVAALLPERADAFLCPFWGQDVATIARQCPLKLRHTTDAKFRLVGDVMFAAVPVTAGLMFDRHNGLIEVMLLAKSPDDCPKVQSGLVALYGREVETRRHDEGRMTVYRDRASSSEVAYFLVARGCMIRYRPATAGR